MLDARYWMLDTGYSMLDNGIQIPKTDYCSLVTVYGSWGAGCELWVEICEGMEAVFKSDAPKANLNYSFFNFHYSLISWSRRADLNRGPADYESAALPTELRRLLNLTGNSTSWRLLQNVSICPGSDSSGASFRSLVKLRLFETASLYFRIQYVI
jgi:hypothetical protein